MTAIFDFSEFPILHTKRLILRQLHHHDAKAMIDLFGSAEVLRFLSQEPTDTLEKAIGLIDWLNSLYTNQDSVQWAICLAENGQVIGTCGNYAWDRENHKAELGYHIVPAEWGKGYATEAAQAIIQWSFENFKLHRMQADCTAGNEASEKVLLKCGFTLEGIQRESEWEHGRFVDIKLFGLLARDYQAARHS